MNNELKVKTKYDFEKDFFKLMNNEVFGKTMENVRKHRDNKLVTTERRRNYVVLESNFHTAKFWYDYVKPKFGEKAKFCYMDTDR